MTNKKLRDYMLELKRSAQLVDDPETPLEEAIAAYQAGAEAYQKCMAILESAEQQIKVIDESLQSGERDV
ncbi:MAG: exodeoxyribonuclease VII small subunit [Clostridiales bacterium]|nr:MAG: exodeoxyribonuclease VII small subunit [Clostridiales bacterium]